MSKLIMGIGIPGSGKTTLLRPFAEKNGYTYISPDDIRAEVSGDAIIQSDMKEVWERVHTRTAEALERGETVVVDATFAKEHERRAFAAFAREHGTQKVQGVFPDVDLETADERNRSRSRVVPRHAMERMDRWFKERSPKIEDGFDSLHVLDGDGKLVRVDRMNENKDEVQEVKPPTGWPKSFK